MKKFVSALLAISMMASTAMLLTACDDYTAQDLQEAKHRYYTGKGTAQDKTMVEGFNEYWSKHKYK